MKFDAAAITPGRAKVCQKGTEPSAKSIQSVPLLEIPQVPAAARCGVAAKAAQAASTMTSSLLIDPDLKVAAREGSHLPRLARGNPWFPREPPSCERAPSPKVSGAGPARALPAFLAQVSCGRAKPGRSGICSRP